VRSLYDIPIARIAICISFAVAIDIEGNVYAWGEMEGLPLTQTPKKLDFPSRVSQITAGAALVVALTPEGTHYYIFLIAFPTYIIPQIGEVYIIGEPFEGIPNSKRVPNGIHKLNFERKVKQVACGFEHCVVLFEDGTVACFGQNDHFQLGSNTSTYRPLLPLLPR